MNDVDWEGRSSMKYFSHFWELHLFIATPHIPICHQPKYRVSQKWKLRKKFKFYTVYWIW